MNFEELKKVLQENGQEHIIKSYERLEESKRKILMDQVAHIDFSQLHDLSNIEYDIFTSTNIEPPNSSNNLSCEKLAVLTKFNPSISLRIFFSISNLH